MFVIVEHSNFGLRIKAIKSYNRRSHGTATRRRFNAATQVASAATEVTVRSANAG